MGRTTPKGKNNRQRYDAEQAQPVSTRVKIVAIIAAMAMILPLIATVAAVTSDPGDGRDQATRCLITEAGVQVRAAGPVAVDQVPEGRVGDTYTSTSGCVPGDTSI